MQIDWRDPWLIGLIAVHVLTTFTTLMTRNNTNFQVLLFLILLSAAYFSESINEYAALNWRSFSKQQYFDSNGLFISTVFSIPILLNCMLLIVSDKNDKVIRKILSDICYLFFFEGGLAIQFNPNDGEIKNGSVKG